jgi:hypothetical protein
MITPPNLAKSVGRNQRLCGRIDKRNHCVSLQGNICSLTQLFQQFTLRHSCSIWVDIFKYRSRHMVSSVGHSIPNADAKSYLYWKLSISSNRNLSGATRIRARRPSAQAS